MWPVKHCINIAFPTQVERTTRVIETCEAFGMDMADSVFTVYEDFEFATEQGDRIYVTGQSGSGKTQLLAALKADYVAAGLRVGDMNEVELSDEPLVDQLGSDTMNAIELLNMAGLNDAHLFIRKPSQLSDGQRYRLKIAKLLEQKVDVMICDEFGAVLDRETAKVLARHMWNVSLKNRLSVVVATTHRDLQRDFGATKTVLKKYAHEKKLIVTDPSELEVY